MTQSSSSTESLTKSGVKAVGSVVILVGVFFLVTSFDVLNHNPDLRSGGPRLLPTTTLLMHAWRPAFGLSLVLTILALVSGAILFRGMRPASCAVTAGALLGAVGTLVPSVTAGMLATILLGIALPVILVGAAELISRRQPRVGIEQDNLQPLSEAAPRSGTNGLAIASLIVVFFSSLIGLILGHVALRQIRATGQDGRGLALAAVIIGWVATGAALLIVVILAVLGSVHSYR